MSKSDKAATGYFEGYASFAGVLRTWLIAYGIGGPVLLVTHSEVAKQLSESGQSRYIAILFLIGVFLQVIVALLYKGAMWYLYLGEEDREIRKTKRYKFSGWLSGEFWVELLFDLASIGLFSWATVRTLNILTLASNGG